MNKVLVTALLAVMSLPVHATHTHGQSSPAKQWSELDRTLWYPQTTVPIVVMHSGDVAEYTISVNGKIVTSEPFEMAGTDTQRVDVPVMLEDEAGWQLFKICSNSITENKTTGASLCSEVELRLLEPSKE